MDFIGHYEGLKAAAAVATAAAASASPYCSYTGGLSVLTTREPSFEDCFEDFALPAPVDGAAAAEAAFRYMLPSIGSASHLKGTCKPCAFLYEGCANGLECQFCHLCPPGELKRRKREKLAARRRQGQFQDAKVPNRLNGSTRATGGAAGNGVTSGLSSVREAAKSAGLCDTSQGK
jgi:hypothetical protein